MKAYVHVFLIIFLAYLTSSALGAGDVYQHGLILSLLETTNFIIHEAGHPIFSIFGEFVGFLGGTLAQLLVPLIFLGYFALRRDILSASVMSWWCGENMIGIAHYIADARAQNLELWGGGEHDWAYLLGQMGFLRSDTAIGSSVRSLGIGIMFLSIGVLMALFLQEWRATKNV